MEKLIKKIEEYINKIQELDSVDIDYLYKVVDILKDLKEVKCMNDYGRYGNYGEYNGRGPGHGSYGEYSEYGRRGVDSRYRASKYMDGMRDAYEAYEESVNAYNNGNYSAKEDGLKELEFMMHEAEKWLKSIKEKATSPEEQEIYRKHIAKISGM